MASVNACRLCGSADLRIVYEGPIRAGGADSGTVDGYRVLHCNACAVEFLDPFPDNLEAYYEGEQYWEDHHGPLDVDKLWAKHGPEQRGWFYEVGLAALRGKRLADFGSGIGIFLDLARNTAAETVGVELAAHFRDHVEDRGHRFVASPAELADASQDVIVSFDTLEHVPVPADFLAEMYRVLAADGVAYIGVPNQQDFLKALVPDYLPFFYHLSHVYYFSAESLRRLLAEAGFQDIAVSFVHKYDLNNLVAWAHDRKGVGTVGSPVFDQFTEDSFRQNLERQGIASHILVSALKRGAAK